MFMAMYIAPACSSACTTGAHLRLPLSLPPHRRSSIIVIGAPIDGGAGGFGSFGFRRACAYRIDLLREEVSHGHEINCFKRLGPFWGVIQRKQTFLGKPDRLLKAYTLGPSRSW